MVRLAVAGSFLLAAAACGTPDDGAPVHRTDLRAATGQSDALPTGVTIDSTGARFVFDERAGLFRIDGDDATLVLARADMPDPGVPVRPPFTDLVALLPGQFAITALGDGFLLDVNAHTMRTYFCYVPDGLPEDQDQRTDAIAYDAANDRLYAQPRTFDVDGNLVRSQIAEYLGSTGIDFDWHDIPLDIDAGGMAFLPDRGLIVGDGTKLYAFNGDYLVDLVDLAHHGVTSIGGLAVDAAADALLVVDDGADELVEIDLTAL